MTDGDEDGGGLVEEELVLGTHELGLPGAAPQQILQASEDLAHELGQPRPAPHHLSTKEEGRGRAKDYFCSLTNREKR